MGDAFNYLAVLISIILGLALTQLLTGAARLVRNRERVKFHAPIPIWMFFFFIVIVQTWWTTFTLRLNEEWTFIEFVIVLVQPTLIFLLVELLAPDEVSSGVIDLRANYFRQAPVFFGVLVFLLIASLARPLIIFGELADPLDVAFHILWIGLSIVGVFWKSPAYHLAAAPIATVLMVTYVGSMFLSLD